jgi:hypothetical protein
MSSPMKRKPGHWAYSIGGATPFHMCMIDWSPKRIKQGSITHCAISVSRFYQFFLYIYKVLGCLVKENMKFPLVKTIAKLKTMFRLSFTACHWWNSTGVMPVIAGFRNNFQDHRRLSKHYLES